MFPAATIETVACDCWRGGGIVQRSCLVKMAHARTLRDQMDGHARCCHTQTDKRVSLLVIQWHSEQIEPQDEPHRRCAREGERALRYLGPRCDVTAAQELEEIP